MKLNSKSPSVQYNLGCGTLGLLQLTVSPAVYNTLSMTPFVVPINPGSVPTIPANSTGAQITELRYAFDTASALFNEYDRTDKALRQSIFSTVDEMFNRVKNCGDYTDAGNTPYSLEQVIGIAFQLVY